MKDIKRIWTGIGAAVCLLVVILDTKTAIAGALEGIELSLKVVVPSLLPFFILSYLIGKSFTGLHISFFEPINRLCGIPNGAESLYLLGFVGGYPVGAKSIENAYEEGCIEAVDARRMLGFCSNAGPAFIFGMAGSLFPSKGPLWALWAIHITSSMLVGCMLPKHKTNPCKIKANITENIPTAVENSVKTMGLVCVWVIVFRVLIAFLRRWFLWLLPSAAEVALVGFLELANGCVFLGEITSCGLRFVLCAVFLSFGGLCVAMQTVSVTRKLGTGMYFPGKLLQSAVSFLIAYFVQFLLFSGSDVYRFPIALVLTILLILCITICLPYRQKKVVAIPV